MIGIALESKFCIFFIISLSIQIEYLNVCTYISICNKFAFIKLSIQIVFVSFLVFMSSCFMFISNSTRKQKTKYDNTSNIRT